MPFLPLTPPLSPKGRGDVTFDNIEEGVKGDLKSKKFEA